MGSAWSRLNAPLGHSRIEIKCKYKFIKISFGWFSLTILPLLSNYGFRIQTYNKDTHITDIDLLRERAGGNREIFQTGRDKKWQER